MSTGRVEATAPCRVVLAGTRVGPEPHPPSHPGAVVAVHVAIDRRAWCRVQEGEGVSVESKDTLVKARARSVEELLASGRGGLVGEILRGLEVERGVRVETQSRVPLGSGLGASSALALAVGASLSTHLGRDVAPDRLGPLLQEAEARSSRTPVDLQDYTTPLRGGVQGVHPGPEGLRVEALAVDPARVEESLLLIDAGEAGSAPADDGAAPLVPAESDEGRKARDVVASVATGVRQALLEERLEDVVGLLDDEWAARKVLDPRLATPEVERVVAVTREAGGAARLLSAGGRAVVAIWAPPGARGPGRREAVTSALGAAGFRVFPARVDLRGLEVG